MAAGLDMLRADCLQTSRQRRKAAEPSCLGTTRRLEELMYECCLIHPSTKLTVHSNADREPSQPIVHPKLYDLHSVFLSVVVLGLEMMPETLLHVKRGTNAGRPKAVAMRSLSSEGSSTLFTLVTRPKLSRNARSALVSACSRSTRGRRRFALMPGWF